MHQNAIRPVNVRFADATLPSQHETLGQVVAEILNADQNLNRKAVCGRLIRRLEQASSREEEQQLNSLIGLMFSGGLN